MVDFLRKLLCSIATEHGRSLERENCSVRFINDLHIRYFMLTITIDHFVCFCFLGCAAITRDFLRVI